MNNVTLDRNCHDRFSSQRGDIVEAAFGQRRASVQPVEATIIRCFMPERVSMRRYHEPETIANHTSLIQEVESGPPKDDICTQHAQIAQYFYLLFHPIYLLPRYVKKESWASSGRPGHHVLNSTTNVCDWFHIKAPPATAGNSFTDEHIDAFQSSISPDARIQRALLRAQRVPQHKVLVTTVLRFL